MALRNEDKDWIRSEISAAVNAMKPHGWRKAVHLTKEWGGIAAFASLFLTLFAITVGALYYAFSRVEKQAGFETNTNRTLEDVTGRLAKIESQLRAVQLGEIALGPINEQSALAAKKLIAESQSAAIRLPANMVTQAGERFVEASEREPTAWGAAIALLQYRTSFNAVPSAVSGQPREVLGALMTHYKFNSPSGAKVPTVYSAGIAVTEEEAAKFGQIGEDLDETEIGGPSSLLAVGGSVVLDGMQLRNVVFRNVHLYYNGVGCRCAMCIS